MIKEVRFFAVVLFTAITCATLRAVEGTWISLAPLTDPRQEVGAAELNGKIYVLGGLPSTNRAQEYDPATNSWRFLAPLPTAVDHTAAATFSGKLYAIGGNISTGSTDAVFEYDPLADQWTQKASMPTARGALAAAVIGTKIYAVGGTSATQRELEAYDPASNTWSRLAPMPTGRNHLAAGAIQGKLYVAGGRPGNLSVLEVYDPQTNSWTTKAPMPTARSGHAAAVVRDRLYTFGGEGNPASPSGIFPQVEVYDPASNTWKSLEPMPTPRHGIGAAAVGSRIFIPGGATREGGGSQTGANEALVVQTEKLFFAHFASGQGISTEVIAGNLSETRTSVVTLELLDQGGNPLEADLNGSMLDKFTTVLAPLGVQSIRSNTPGSSLRVGSVVISSELAASGTILFTSTVPGFRGTAGVGASALLTRFFVPVQRDPSTGIDSGIAVANSEEGPVTMTLTLRNESGAVLGRRALTLPARGQMAGFLTQLFPGADTVTVNFRGSVSGTSSGFVSALALLVTGSEFATLPVSAY